MTGKSMKITLVLLVGVVLGSMSTLLGQDSVPGQSGQTMKRDKDQERAAYHAELAKVYKEVPTAAKMEKRINEMFSVLLTVEDESSASAAAQKIKGIDRESKALEEPLRNELAAYAKGRSRTDIGMRIFMSTINKQGVDLMAIVEGIKAQGNMTKDLASSLNLKKAMKPVSACPPMSKEVTAYWKKKFSNLNQLNRTLFSLNEKKDISRVTEELKEIRKSRNEIKQVEKSLYLLKVDSDVAGSGEMDSRFNQGPIRVLNHILSIVDARGFVRSEDPDVQDISALISELTK